MKYRKKKITFIENAIEVIDINNKNSINNIQILFSVDVNPSRLF
jgi:hypothetical protein